MVLERAIAPDPGWSQRLMNVPGGTASFRSLFDVRVMGNFLAADLTRSIMLTY
jgi:hypothetical protein